MKGKNLNLYPAHLPLPIHGFLFLFLFSFHVWLPRPLNIICI